MIGRAARAVATLLVPASLVLAGPAVGASDGAAEVVGPVPRAVQLSGPEGAGRWAHPARRALVRSGPENKGRAVTHLRLLTEDGFPEVYLLISSFRDSSAKEWVRLRIPGRPNGRTGWVPRDALGDFHVVHTTLLVDRARHRLTLRKSGKVLLTFRIGVGKRSTPTPAGFFWIREKFHAGGGTYGPRAMGTAAYAPGLSDWPAGGVIGLHGTDQPWLIPGSPSHGCIRLRNADIVRLYRLVPVGTPVRVV
jgi:hypothetical protein